MNWNVVQSITLGDDKGVNYIDLIFEIFTT